MAMADTVAPEPVGDGIEGARFRSAIDAIDAANAGDPVTLVIDGVARPKEQAHAEAMTAWVQRLDPRATEAQLLAARAHHLRRWTLARSDYPAGRAGYLRWRADQKRRHAAEVGEILRACGYDDGTVQRVGAIVRKEGLGSDPAVQVHEDALCLVFLETQAEPVAAELGTDKTVAVLVKTLPKMSERGRGEALALSLPDAVRDLLARALAELDVTR
jgi:hypothetical protein